MLRNIDKLIMKETGLPKIPTIRDLRGSRRRRILELTEEHDEES
jgi:hypothetical protein